MYENLKIIDLAITTEPYRLYSYYPKFFSYLPPKFRGSPTVIVGSNDTYNTADGLSDHFIEDVRLSAKRYDQEMSILESWDNDECLKGIFEKVLHEEFITPKIIREVLYHTIRETRIFNPTWAKALLKLVIGDNLAGKKWLDISSGWGDRLLTAMLLDMDYIGFDPNFQLKPGHSEMISMFGDPNKHRVIYEPFETAKITELYDVVLTSPPFFTVEEYAKDQQGQSIVNYPNFEQWMVWFLFVSLEKAWNALNEGGYLILHLGDIRTMIMSEATNIFIENYLPNCSWEGVIGIENDGKYPRPTWVWKKISYGQNRWQPKKPALFYRSLYNTYPELHKELVRYQASLCVPDYLVRDEKVNRIQVKFDCDNLLIDSILQINDEDTTISLLTKLFDDKSEGIYEDFTDRIKITSPEYYGRYTNISNVRKQVSYYLINNLSVYICQDTIYNLFGDNLMMSLILETIGVSDTIKWCIDIIKQSHHI